ncbi:MAG TPA: hypothetical protein VF533_08245, partial [Solirubrobacteraceae bacterium]
MSAALDEVAPGVWRWSGRHPEWHPRTAFGSEVASWVLRTGDDTVVVDPLLGDGDAALLDPVASGRVLVAVTIPYHVRSAAEVAARYGGEVLGHAAVARRLPAGTRFRAVSPGDDLPHGMVAFGIGSPPRQELPL